MSVQRIFAKYTPLKSPLALATFVRPASCLWPHAIHPRGNRRANFNRNSSCAQQHWFFRCRGLPKSGIRVGLLYVSHRGETNRRQATRAVPFLGAEEGSLLVG